MYKQKYVDCSNVWFFVIILYACLTLPLVNQRVKKHLTVLFLKTPTELVIILIKFLHKVEMQTIMEIAKVEYKVGNETLTGPNSRFKSFSSINIFNLLNYLPHFISQSFVSIKQCNVVRKFSSRLFKCSKKMMSSHQHNAD